MTDACGEHVLWATDEATLGCRVYSGAPYGPVKARRYLRPPPCVALSPSCPGSLTPYALLRGSLSGNCVHPSPCLWLCLWGIPPETRPLDLLFPLPRTSQGQLFTVSSHLSSNMLPAQWSSLSTIQDHHFPRHPLSHAAFPRLQSRLPSAMSWFLDVLAVCAPTDSKLPVCSTRSPLHPST